MSIKEFKDNNGITLAYANIPDDYVIGGMLNNTIQSEHVPFTWSVHALNQEKNINVFCLSEEKFYEYRSMMLKQSVKLLPNIIKTSIRNYEEPENYLRQFAEAIFGGSLNEVAYGNSPSLYNVNLQNSYNNLGNLANTVASNEAQSGYQCNINNLTCKSYLVKYTGIKEGVNYVVLGAMDFEGYEMKYPMNQMFGAFNMFGGLFGGNNKQAQANQQHSDVLGHGDCDMLEWGSKNRYLMIAPEAVEQEATETFVNFLSTLQMDNNLYAQFNNLIIQRMQQNMMQTAQYQAQAQANIQGNMYQQQKLTNMLRQNSQTISAGIMDSWDKKMASESRMSQNYSEAIRGVNVYQNSYGQNVDVSVSADHVYENKYGDVYGVSGNAIDNDVLSKLNWKEIKK